MQHDRADLTEYADSASVIEEARSEGSGVINLVTVAAFYNKLSQSAVAACVLFDERTGGRVEASLP